MNNKTLKEEFNEYLSNIEFNDYPNNEFKTKIIDNTMEVFFIDTDLNILPNRVNNAIELYVKFGREFFLEIKEQFLEYKVKKDFKDRLESKLPIKNTKTKGNKI